MSVAAVAVPPLGDDEVSTAPVVGATTSQPPLATMAAAPSSEQQPLSFTFRHARVEDMDAIVSFTVFNMRQTFVQRLRLGPLDYYLSDEFEHDIRKSRLTCIHDPLSFTILALSNDGEIHGVIEWGPTRPYPDIDPSTAPRWELKSIYTSDASRGTRLGSRLVSKAVRTMLRLEPEQPFPSDTDYAVPGDSCIVLTPRGNTASAFYSKLGARDFCDCPNYSVSFATSFSLSTAKVILNVSPATHRVQSSQARGILIDVVSFSFDWPTLQKLANSSS